MDRFSVNCPYINDVKGQVYKQKVHEYSSEAHEWGRGGISNIEIQQILLLLVAGFLDIALMAYIFTRQRSKCSGSIVTHTE